MHYKKPTIAALTCFYILLSPLAHADFVATLSVETTPQPSGLILYQYTLSVLPNSSLPSNGLNLTIDIAADLQPTGQLPPGWDVFYDSGDPSIAWAAEEFAPYLQPGSNTVFSFMSFLPPVTQEYTLFGLDTTGQIDGIISGTIAGPGIASVPEPTSVIMLGTGLTAVACSGWYCRGKSSRPSSH